MKIDESQVPTTKQSLEFRFSLSKSGIPDQQEFLHFLIFFKKKCFYVELSSKINFEYHK